MKYSIKKTALRFTSALVSAVIAASLSIGTFSLGTGAGDLTLKRATVLQKLNIFLGSKEGFQLDKGFTREQSVIMALRLAGKFDEAGKEDAVQVFTDIPAEHWAAKYVNYAKRTGLTSGIGSGKFGTGKVVSSKDYLTLLLRTLDYNDKEGDFDWRTPYDKAYEAGIINDDELDYFKFKYPDFPLKRNMVVNFTYQSFLCGVKDKNYTLVKKLLNDGILTEDQVSNTLDNDIFLALRDIPEKRITIRHFTVNSDDKTYVKKFFADFEQENPNIKMEIIAVPWEMYELKLKTMLASGCSPDISSHWGQKGFMEYYDKKLLADLTGIIKDSGFKPSDYHIPENVYNFFNVKGRQYGIPVDTYVSAILYNKNMFDAANLPYPTSDYEDKSWTFETMVETAKKLTKSRNDASKAQIGLEFSWGEWDMRPMYFGEKVYSDDTWINGGHPSRVFFDSPGVINAYQRFADLIYKDKCSAASTELAELGGDQGDPFAAGKLAISCAGIWMANGSKDFSFNTGLAAIPWYKTNLKERAIIWSDPLFILRDCKYPKEAFKWIEYEMRTDVQRKAVELSGGTPPSNTEALDAYYKTLAPISEKELKNVFEGGMKYGIQSTNQRLSNYSAVYDSVLSEISVLENKNVPASKVCKSLQAKVNALLKDGS